MKVLNNRLVTLLAVVGVTTANAFSQEYYEKYVIFPDDATIDVKVDMASRLVPTAKQLAWQQLELTAFLHFGVNTFTDREWGDGTEDPHIFCPDDLDTDQWVSTLRDAGFKMVMLTAKHHDGFCLWPTATTTHSVASSSWLGGKGDVVGQLAESCRKYDMKLGLYLSPWDRNAACYGDSEAYNDMFVEQLTELLTRYGDVYEVWFDGACGEGPNGKKQVYDWQRFKSTIEQLQPNAVVAIMGDDVRWVGNEKGLGRDTEWSATAFVPGILAEADSINKSLALFPKAPDLGSRALLEKVDRLYWWPSEVDVSIRPGWFYHDSQVPHSLYRLASIYINSVGKNSVLLLNIPPDKHGRIADMDVLKLKELKAWIDKNFGQSLTSQQGVDVPVGQVINSIMLGEDISRGQRVEAFEVEALVDHQWRKVAQGTTIGIKRIMMIDDVNADSIRLNVKQSRGNHNATIIGAFKVEMPQAEVPTLRGGYRLLDKKKWRVAKGTEAAIDDDTNTVWKSADGVMQLQIDLGKKQEIAGFTYVPRQDDVKEGMVFKYEVLVSDNGGAWRKVPANGEFSNIVNNPIAQTVYFSPSVKGRYFLIKCLETADGSPGITIADIDLLTR